MNAKKIMGAVLVALLAFAVFAGAGAAVTAADDGKTVFVGQVVPGFAGTTWTNGDNKVIFNAEGYITGPVVEGKYSYNDTVSVTILNPTVIISGIAGDGEVQYDVSGSTYYLDDKLVISFKSPVSEANITDILITNPDGTKIKFTEAYLDYFKGYVDGLNLTAMQAWLPSAGVDNLNIATIKAQVIAGAEGKKFDAWDYTANGKITINPSAAGYQGEFDSGLIDALFPESGTYKLQGILGNNGTSFKFAPGINTDNLVGQDVFTFTVASAKDVTITASVDSVLDGQKFTVIITGQPGEMYKLFYEDDEVSIYSAGANTISGKTFEMPNSGSITIYMKAEKDGEAKVGVAKADKSSADEEVTIKILKATLTVTLGAPSYFIGDEIEVIFSSDSKLADEYTFNITGTNYPATPISGDDDEEDGKLIYKLVTSGKKLDVGTYTIKINKGSDVVATLPVALKQPFISIAEAPEVVVQNKSASFFINAEATDAIQAYIFGTNKFIAVFNGSIEYVDDEDGKDILNLFNVTLEADVTKNMSAGQYFAVFQHPMYDGDFNINATKEGAFYLNTSANVVNKNGELLFNASDRQTANAAQALCDALESQNIDDMYVKASFFVVGKGEVEYSISDVPATIAQGETLTISGVSTANADNKVVVEMISTAFAAVPKDTVGSAAFILVTTEVAEDGTWEVTLDTSDLNVDEYSLSVVCEGQTWKNVNINVVEADEPVTPEQPEEPEQPEQPEEPVAPATPGFGALAALAGLGAVAVLLLRRE